MLERIKVQHWLIGMLLSLASYTLCAVEPAGKTIIAKGQVDAISGKNSRSLTRRAPVFKVDKVVTGTKSRAQFKMVDGGLLAVKENTELEIATYQYDPVTQKGSAVMNLITGGVRSISGKLKSHDGAYLLKTPMGSIGIRGTHFEVEIIDGELFIAVWDGAIDFTLGGNQAKVIPFGDGAEFNFAAVRGAQVTGLLTPPANFTSDESEQSNDEDDGSGQDSSSQNDSEQGESENAPLISSTSEGEGGSDSSAGAFEIDILPVLSTEQTTSQANQLALEAQAEDPSPQIDRVGQATFDLTEHTLTSQLGAIDAVKMGMQVNFDQQTVEDGFLSFNDKQGEWYARFNGAIRQAELELGVNFASHGDNRASGEIQAQFLSEDRIGGNIQLQEMDNQEISAGGTFILDEVVSSDEN